MTLSFIPFIISKIKNKRSNNNLSNNLYNKNYLDKYKSVKCKKYGLIILSSFFTFLFKIIHYALNFYATNDISFWFFAVIFISIFSYFILKIKFYKHQYLSIIIFLISGIILNTINCWKNEIQYVNIILTLMNQMINSLNMVLKKYIVEYTFCYVSELIFYEGIITLVLFIITLIICTNIELSNDIKDCEHVIYNGKCYFDNFNKYYESLDTSQVFIFLFIMLYYTPYFYCFFNTMKSYTVFHLFIIYMFEEDIFYEIFDGTEKEVWLTVSNVILFIIVFFMILVFTEIIELNFCKLSENIKRNISKRADDNYKENEGETDSEITQESSAELEESCYNINQDIIYRPSNL